MKKNITVPQLDRSTHTESGYTVTVDYAEAVREGERKLGADRVGRHYYYRAEETDEVYRLTRYEVAQIGAGEMDERGCDYSLWCSQTGRLIRRPSAAVRQALGITD